MAQTHKPAEPMAAPEPAPAAAPTVQPQPAAIPQGQPVQYVMAQKSLEGLGGWLIGWLLWLALWAVGGITSFFSLLESGSSSSTGYSRTTSSADNTRTISLLFLPIIVGVAITAVVFIAQRKKRGVTASLGFIGATGLYSITASLLGSSETSAAAVAGGISAVIVICGLQALYFFQSDRVKATLTK